MNRIIPVVTFSIALFSSTAFAVPVNDFSANDVVTPTATKLLPQSELKIGYTRSIGCGRRC